MTRKCPACPDVELLAVQRSGVTIDYCPNCRGVWLDRGELEKLINREQDLPASGPTEPMRPADPDEYRHYSTGEKPRKPSPRRSFLADIFNLFD